MYPRSLTSEFVFPTPVLYTHPAASTQLSDGPYPMQARRNRPRESQEGYHLALKPLRIPEKTRSLELSAHFLTHGPETV